MEQFIMEIKPYTNADTIVYVTNYYEVAKEAVRELWVPIMPLKETININTSEPFFGDSNSRELWMYKTVEGDYADDYMNAFDELKAIIAKMPYGHADKLEFGYIDDAEYYNARKAYIKRKELAMRLKRKCAVK